jgi:hypothetical protein
MRAKGSGSLVGQAKLRVQHQGLLPGNGSRGRRPAARRSSERAWGSPASSAISAWVSSSDSCCHARSSLIRHLDGVVERAPAPTAGRALKPFRRSGKLARPHRLRATRARCGIASSVRPWRASRVARSHWPRRSRARRRPTGVRRETPRARAAGTAPGGGVLADRRIAQDLRLLQVQGQRRVEVAPSQGELGDQQGVDRGLGDRPLRAPAAVAEWRGRGDRLRGVLLRLRAGALVHRVGRGTAAQQGRREYGGQQSPAPPRRGHGGGGAEGITRQTGHKRAGTPENQRHE